MAANRQYLEYSAVSLLSWIFHQVDPLSSTVSALRQIHPDAVSAFLSTFPTKFLLPGPVSPRNPQRSPEGLCHKSSAAYFYREIPHFPILVLDVYYQLVVFS